MSAGDFITRRRVGWLAVIAMLLFLAWSYFFALQYFPQALSDEAVLLNIPYRICKYGDFRYTSHWSHSFGMQNRVRMWPPICALALRNAYHVLVGFSSHQSRVFSALLMFSVILSSLLFLRCAIGRWNPWFVVLFVCQLGFTPAYIYTARSVRFEQEVFFLGWCGSLLLPCLLLAVRSPKLRIAIWFACGFFQALAASSHPLGMAFVPITVIWMFVFARRLKEIDSLNWLKRGLIWSAGLFVGCLPTFIWIASDVNNFLQMSQCARDCYSVRSDVHDVRLSERATWTWLLPYLPTTIVARLNVIDAAAYKEVYSYPIANYGGRILLQIWFYCQIVIVFGFFIRSLICRFANANIWIHLAQFFALGFLLFNFAYIPNDIYRMYPCFFVHLAAALVVWNWMEKSNLRLGALAPAATAGLLLGGGFWLACKAIGRAENDNAVLLLSCLVALASALGFWQFRLRPAFSVHRTVAALVCSVFLFAGLLLADYGCRHALRITPSTLRGNFSTVPLDRELAAVRSTSQKLGLHRDEAKVYTISGGWIAAGRNPHAIWETVMGGLQELPTDHDGAVFQLLRMVHFRGQVRSDAPFPSHEEWVERVRKFLRPLQLAGVVINEAAPTQAYSLYRRQKTESNTLVAAFLKKDGATEFTSARLVRDVNGDETRRPIKLQKGRYVAAILMKEKGLGKRVRFFLHCENVGGKKRRLVHRVARQTLAHVSPYLFSFEAPCDDCRLNASAAGGRPFQYMECLRIYRLDDGG